MSEKKNIDRLFQEKFKDFEVNPPEISWANIEAKLDGKKKRRVIPFWWKLSGVAAVFLIGFLVSKSIYDGDTKSENPVVNQEKSNDKNSEDSNKNGFKIKGKSNTNSIVNKENSTNPENVNSSNSGENEIRNNSTIQNKNAVVNENNSNKSQQSGSKKGLRNNNSNSTNAVATTSDEVKANASSERKNTIKNTINSSSSSFAGRNSTNQSSLKNKTNSENNKVIITESVFEKSQNQVAQNSKENNKSTAEKEIVQIENEKISKSLIDTKNINLDGLKGESNSKIIAQETVKKANDTTANSVVSNALEELLNEKESKQKQESKRNRWQLTSNVAPVFLGSIANGSPIDSTLSKNSKSYNTNVGFGVGVSYAVSKKLSVRTGLNKVNVSYNTNDISFFTAIEARTMKNVSPTISSAAIQIQSNVTPNNPNLGLETEFLPFENSIAPKNNGYLMQEMGYLEMPVEMTYNLLDKKFGIKIIGGFSTLFLQDNSIVIVSEGRDTLLGEANNLNNVHFSTNLGLGLKYGFMKSFEFNIEPTLKYQLNTFSDNAGNFKPYIFGIYSGMSYKF